MKQITLRHVVVRGNAFIGLEYKHDKVIEALMATLPMTSWNEGAGVTVMRNNKANLDRIFMTFKGVAWVNGKYFFGNKPIHKGSKRKDLSSLKRLQSEEGYKRCPDAYIEKLELNHYSIATARTYLNCFEGFLNFHKNNQDPMLLNERDIRAYLSHLHKNKLSDSYINQAINSIKFFYERVHNMPSRFYQIERPRKKQK